MTPKQKYLFDLRGYLHLENVLTPEELSDAQAAIERLVQSSPDELPPGISSGGEGFSNGFSADKSLEALTRRAGMETRGPRSTVPDSAI